METCLPQLDAFTPESFCAIIFSLACLRVRPGASFFHSSTEHTLSVGRKGRLGRVGRVDSCTNQLASRGLFVSTLLCPL